MSSKDEALYYHQLHKGKLETTVKVPLKTETDLSLAYSPGVAEPCKVIYDRPEAVYDYTLKGNTVAIVTDGTAVLGLGNIGPTAALPVMEGKAVLLKSFAGVDAFPICLQTTDVEKIIETVKLLEPTFGGVNLEDIAAPNCFEIEERLKKELNIPVFHDDQHGTAIVTVAGLVNAVKLTGRRISDCKVIVNGAGAAGIAIIKLLANYGVQNMIMCDSKGAVYEGRAFGMNPIKQEVAKFTNLRKLTGSLEEVIKGADVFIGVSVADVLTKEMIATMNAEPIIFAMANPEPEILPDEARKAGAAVIGTGRSDFPNQINNVLAFPGMFRGALDVQASDINEKMKQAAVEAIAGLIHEDELSSEYVIPNPFDPKVAPKVAAAVAQAAMESGVARVHVNPNDVKARTERLASRK
ncbi:NAD-dependent malic enzyme [Caldibacillus lycopersici]|uniref:NAD-dependent malic enzyme n=1 Tax=Perspicuibacillus lycopersici TaxID=1325689 RepID=A0AAE3IVL5_9BACI|nr:malic enzyme-like NAD(P)-binding protein [Perspicuibacillus lycopersici]MCU9614194.1 NAD-dependent malic enzyme [Perspicuibacillus lycopersici]